MHKLATFSFFFALLFAAQPGAADPRLGFWKLISAQSSLDPPNRLSIASQHGEVHVVITGKTHADFTAKLNGHDTAVPNNPAFDQIELRKIDKHQVEVKEKKNGAVVVTIHDRLSKDGNQLTSKTSQAGHPDQFTVWKRAGGKRSATDLFAGDWSEDLSKSRIEQGMEVKIEADGKDGVRFSSDYSYSARFDGKEYDLKNSTNDTVTLQLVDAHTVDAVYRRDNQVTQTDRWVVSADGAQMTMTSSGVLETGQQLKETLVFRKREDH